MRFLLGLTALACASFLVGCGANANGRANNGPVALTHTPTHTVVNSPSLSTEPAPMNLGESLAALQHSVARIEQRMDSLESRFTTLKLEPQSKPRLPATKTAKKVAPTKQPHAPKAVTGNGVYAVRVGTHADKVRVVFDMGNTAKTNIVLDEAENLLSVDIEGAAWNTTQQSTYKAGQAVLESYQVTPRENGATVVFALKGATKILQQSTLKNPTRLVIDLAR